MSIVLNNKKPYKVTYEGTYNGDCFELEVFNDGNWQVIWLDKDHGNEVEKQIMELHEGSVKNELYITLISHDNGTNLYLAKSDEGMTDQLYEYVKDDWNEHDWSEDVEVPEDKQEAIDEYFSQESGSFLEYQDSVLLDKIPD